MLFLQTETAQNTLVTGAPKNPQIYYSIVSNTDSELNHV